MSFHVVLLVLFGVCSLPVWVLSRKHLKSQLKFLWYSIVQPAIASSQKSRLKRFYGGQAEIVDHKLTRGRQSLLSLCAAHLRVLRATSTKQRLVWVDIGGGTGYSIELMNEYFPISSFDSVYIVDLRESLLTVARARIARNGWKNVQVLCQDPRYFQLPGVQLEGSVGFATMSHSLSMMDGFHRVVDHVHQALDPQGGLIGAVDLCTDGKRYSDLDKAVESSSRQWGWLSRWFWRVIFEFDHNSLNPERRSYLQHKFGTVKYYETRSSYIPFIAQIPYYIWIGRPRSDGSSQRGSLDFVPSKRSIIPDTESGTIAALPNAFDYHIGTHWRMPYNDHPVHKQFRTYIYAFTWEDPEEDMRHLELTSEDSVLAITSAGDNVLHYAIATSPERIHCVDMNPYQGHLVELKLAAIHTLDYTDFFAMFGEGRHPNFRHLLDSKIAPYLSAAAYDFWRANEDAFSSAFYLRGYSGWAIYLMQKVFKMAGASEHVKAFCNADTLQEQDRIWWTHLRPVMLNPVVVALMKNPMFCWHALGVPLNQRKMLLNDGGVYEYIRDTLDPLASSYLLKTGAYFYLLALLGHYTHESCPAYLTRAGFDKLKANSSEALDAFQLHTDSILSVMRGLPDHSLTRVVIMDHLDWFPPGSLDVDAEIENLYRLLSVGGLVFWRSAARTPWYAARFEAMGFKVTALGVRTGPKIALDRVNMYASFFKATKLA